MDIDTQEGADEPASAPPQGARRDDLDGTLVRLRNRSILLRTQAYGGLLLIVVISISLILFLSSRQFSESQVDDQVAKLARPPFSVKLFEDRHSALSDKMDNLIDTLQQQTTYQAEHRIAFNAPNAKLQYEITELKELRKEIATRLAKDRENMQLEVRQLKDERDSALRSRTENGVLLRLIGEAAFRIGAILLAIYFISILASISKYLMRVADHLNAVADSIDMLSAAGMPLEKGISSLTPHPIDFHIDDVLTLRNLKDLIGVASAGDKGK